MMLACIACLSSLLCGVFAVGLGAGIVAAWRYLGALLAKEDSNAQP